MLKLNNAIIDAVNQAPPPPTPGLTPGHQHFFALDGKFPGLGTLELPNPPGWGRKKQDSITKKNVDLRR